MLKERVTTHDPSALDKAKKALTKWLPQVGIQPKLKSQAIPGTKLHRLTVIAEQFEKLRPSERQDLVWRILSQNLTPEEQLMLSMVVTLTPKEISGK